MNCQQCGFYYQAVGGDFPTCHYEGPDEWAPCVLADEEDRNEYERREEEEERRYWEEEYYNDERNL